MPSEHANIEELYRQYAPTLFRRARGLLGDDEANDVVQDTFIRYMNAGYTKGSPFALLYRIVTNLSIDKLRSRSRHDHESDEEHPLTGGFDTGQRVGSAMDLSLLTRGLKDKYLMVGVLYHVDGYSQEEVAESLNMSRRSVGKTLKRVQEHMQQRAARLGYTDPALAEGVQS